MLKAVLSPSPWELVQGTGLIKTESSWNRTVLYDQRPSSVPVSPLAKSRTVLEKEFSL